MFIERCAKYFSDLCILGISGSGGSSKSSSLSISSSKQFQGIKDPFVRDAINAIISLQGVTPELQQQRDNRKAVADKSGEAADKFSFENFKDLTDKAVSQLVRQSNEKSKPLISRSVESAGVSGDALSALLTNDLNTRTAEAGAGLLAKIFKDVGSLETENRRTQAGLSTIDTTGINALIASINAAKVGEASSSSFGTGKSSSFNASLDIL